MSEPSTRGEKARLFAALNPPEAVRGALATLMRQIGPLPPGWRWLDPDALHLTVRFFGDVPVPEIPALQARMHDMVARYGPIHLRLSGWGAFPSPRRAQVLWLGLTETDGDPLASLARDLALLPPPAEKRPFKPHLTMARCRVEHDLSGLLTTLPAYSQEWMADGVALMRSYLKSGSAQYEPIAYLLDDPPKETF
ncbi:MAG: RNA 2',3'-cyclic phosphodiesterase [Magnetococcales bacterium]|nr:RNA 2',3'-cyclic phosphodiesterase [Magnetococcales bacterium]